MVFQRFRSSKQLLFIQILMIAVSLFVFSMPKSSQADSQLQPAFNVNIQVTEQGREVPPQSFWAVSYETAFERIKSGHFPSSVLQSPTWGASQDSEGKISIGGQKIGEGLKLDDDAAREVISVLLGSNPALLQQIQSATVTTKLNTIGVSNLFPFHSRLGVLTDNDGKATVKVPKGLIAILDNSQELLKLTSIEKDSSLQIQANASLSGLSVKTDISERYATGQNAYTIAYGTTFHYMINIPQNLVAKGGMLRLIPSSNIKILSVNGQAENPSINMLGPDVTAASMSSDASQQILQTGASLVGRNLLQYPINIAPQTGDVELQVEAEFVPNFDIQKNINQVPKASLLNQNIPVAAWLKPDTNFSFSVTLDNGSQKVQADAPSLNTTGINFAQINSEKNHFVKGGSYLLGKKVNGKSYIYNQDGSWREENNQENWARVPHLSLTGGHSYVMSDSSPHEILMNFTNTSFNAKVDGAVNQSLIKIIGLAADTDYFLYQLTAPEGYPKNNDLIAIKPFRQSLTSPNGTAIQRTSINTAIVQSSSLNFQIPDYVVGQNEYNILSETLTKPSSNLPAIIKMAAAVFAFGVLIAILAVVILRRA